jgi:tRNA-(ms[2]io[6]A)-hydroxylase
VDARIEVVRAVEQELITTPDEQFRFHSGVPA